MFAREYQKLIFSNLDYNLLLTSTRWFVERFGARFEIMCCHLTLTFLPYSDLSLRFIDTYFQSLLMNIICLATLPILICLALLEFIFTGDMKAFVYMFEFILNFAVTSIILPLEIASGILSLVTKPLITLGFLSAYTADFMIDLFSTPEIVEEPNKLARLENLDALLLHAFPR